MPDGASHDETSGDRPATRRSALRRLDLHLLRNHPRLRVLRLHLVVALSLVMTALATLHGRRTPGSLDNVNDTDALAAAWFFVACLPASWWMIVQWRDRQDLPRGVGAHLVWSGAASFLCIALFFVPPVAYSNANAAAVRETMLLAPLIAALDELAEVQTVRYVTYDKHGNVWREDTAKLGVYFYRVEDSDERKKCEDLPSACLRTGHLANSYYSMDRAECRGIQELSDGSRQALEAIYDKKRIDSACGEPEGPRASKAREEIARNLRRFLTAHQISRSEGLFRGPRSLMGLGGFILFLSGILSLSGVLSGNIVFMSFTSCVCIMAFAFIYGRSLGTPSSFAVVFKVALVLGPVITLVVLAASRRRSWWSDAATASLVLIAPVLAAVWGSLMPGWFTGHSMALPLWGVRVPEGGAWILGTFLLLLFASPFIGSLLDRYRNLPRDR